jgi:hypothetical protein
MIVQERKMTETEFVNEVRWRVHDQMKKVGLLADCVGNTKDQTVAKVEACAFVAVLAAMLDRVGKPI